MCGRFTNQTPPEELQRAFRLSGFSGELHARYNIAPSQSVPAVLNDGRRWLEPLHWGLIPWWSKDPKGGPPMINARVETLESKPAFREALERRRCVVLADGFYEWKQVGGSKVPYFIHRKDRRPFAFAGLWDRWGKGDEVLRSCTLITVPPVGLFAELHDRMPAILPPAEMDAWLAPGEALPDQLKALLVPTNAEDWAAYPVSALVNSPHNESPELIAEVALPPERPQPAQLDLLDVPSSKR